METFSARLSRAIRMNRKDGGSTAASFCGGISSRRTAEAVVLRPDRLCGRPSRRADFPRGCLLDGRMKTSDSGSAHTSSQAGSQEEKRRKTPAKSVPVRCHEMSISRLYLLVSYCSFVLVELALAAPAGDEYESCWLPPAANDGRNLASGTLI
jgi:hypothetical protein